ncbi:DUF2934 domain-containing protein [Bradyrhizobium niftali]|uniref:DUF2934 domain-containing protein n=1 Tax=Bradyrhizobium niftali TaxID=2560055 RepID=UPI00322140BE
MRACEVWRAAGKPSGDVDRFWYAAEKQLLTVRSQPDDLPPGMTDNLPVRDRSRRVTTTPRAFEQRTVNV